MTLVLTDGMMLHADRGRGLTFNGHQQTVDEVWWSDLGIKVTVIDDGVLYHVTVPFEEIAGITPLEFHEETRYESEFNVVIDGEILGTPTETDLPYADSSSRVLKLDLLEKARRRGFAIESPFRIGKGLGIAASFPPTYGPLGLDNDTLLYGDWDFFRLLAGGLTGAGGGAAGFSFSLNWERSLLADLEKHTKKRVVDVAEVCKENGNVALRGFPIFFDFEELPSAERAKYALEIEGSLWWPLVVSREPAGDEEPPGSWVYALTKAAPLDSWPRQLWKRIPTAIRFYGEVIHAQVETQFGRAECVLKTRAIAVLAKDKGCISFRGTRSSVRAGVYAVSMAGSW
jgi:hypothetical protein